MTRIEKGSLRETGSGRGQRRGKTVSRRRTVSTRPADDRQIDEIERTFTLRYEW